MKSVTCRDAEGALLGILAWRKRFVSLERSYYTDAKIKQSSTGYYFIGMASLPLRQKTMSVGYSLAKVESVIEDMKRLESYKDEIHGMKASNLNFQDWGSIKPSDKPADEGQALFVIIPHK